METNIKHHIHTGKLPSEPLLQWIKLIDGKMTTETWEQEHENSSMETELWEQKHWNGTLGMELPYRSPHFHSHTTTTSFMSPFSHPCTPVPIVPSPAYRPFMMLPSWHQAHIPMLATPHSCLHNPVPTFAAISMPPSPHYHPNATSMMWLSQNLYCCI